LEYNNLIAGGNFKMSDQKTILCVDDEVEIIVLLTEELEDSNLKVLSANSGNDAFEIFQKNKIDCVISDVRMPNGNGVQLTKNIRGENANIPIYLITGYLDHSEKEVNSLGVTAVVFKPFDVEELVEMVLHSLK
jgi:CheY-like chemotaxis protein